MDIYLLFRKKSPLTQDNLPWLKGAKTHSYPAKRNISDSASVSAILVCTLIACLDGVAEYAESDGIDNLAARVRSSSTPGSFAQCALRGLSFFISPGGAGDPARPG